MKKAFILTSTLIIALTYNPLYSFAELKPNLSSKCLEEIKYRNDTRNKLIMNDIISTFNLDIDQSGYSELSSRDLDAANLIYGGRIDDTFYNSLNKHFETVPSTQGNPRLYVRPLTAYLLYKESDTTNVMVSLKLKGNKWKVVEEKKAKGKEVKYNRVKCEKEYLKKRNEYEKNN
ncbi:hypothetical protein [Metabacillus litoralis]|uniref:hypothetical protein n=1 Tax=Metabacillus litoralis TaxID=152268 RepID=UPI001CFE65CD|nr:hypothetical protein [Metabacillus litoralis]